VLERNKASLSDGYEFNVASRAQNAVFTDLRMLDQDELSPRTCP
jgi:hypothetical protein